MFRRTLKPDEFKSRIEALATETRRELERTRALHDELMRVRSGWLDELRDRS